MAHGDNVCNFLLNIYQNEEHCMGTYKLRCLLSTSTLYTYINIQYEKIKTIFKRDLVYSDDKHSFNLIARIFK